MKFEGILFVTFSPLEMVEYLYCKSLVDVVIEMEGVGLKEKGLAIVEMLKL